MLMNKSISLKTVDLEKSLPVWCNSNSDISKKRESFPHFLFVNLNCLFCVRLSPIVILLVRSFVQNRKLLDIGIPKSSPSIKKPSRWERAKAVIYRSPSLLAKTLSILQRTPSSPASSEADSPKVLTENPVA
jgi:hypothetical protein